MTDEEYTPPVDPNDLKSAWAVMDELNKHVPESDPNLNPGTATAVAIGPDIERACSPGANAETILYRLTWLGLMQEIAKSGELTHMNLPKALKDDKPSNAVFKAFAVVRMSRLQQTEHKEFPVDLEDLGRLIRESEA